MVRLPPLPSWDAMHPVVVHFPIALLLVAPLLMLGGLAWRRHGRGMLAGGAAVLAMGVAGAFLATATGEAGEGAATLVPNAGELLHEHEELGELARNLFLGVLILATVTLFVLWRRLDGLSNRIRLVLAIGFLGAWTVPALTLMNAAHLGGRLVHELGVRAPMSGGEGAPVPMAPPGDGEAGGSAESE